ncbi:MAG: hypothetical protein FWG68_04185 [Defluviitaleaceae bacterium]|nr:hypothetical protein [Defluviitaleaceae bacterium]
MSRLGFDEKGFMRVHLYILKNQANKLFSKLGFTQQYINNNLVHTINGEYCKLTFISAFNGFVIETAENITNATNNLYEDSDVISLENGTETFFDDLEQTLRNYYLL